MLILFHKFLSISSTKVKVNSNNDIAQKGSTLRSLVWLWTNSPLQRNVPGLSWPHFALWSNIRPNLWKTDSLTWSNVSLNVIKSGPYFIIPRKDEYLTILRYFFQSAMHICWARAVILMQLRQIQEHKHKYKIIWGYTYKKITRTQELHNYTIENTNTKYGKRRSSIFILRVCPILVGCWFVVVYLV